MSVDVRSERVEPIHRDHEHRLGSPSGTDFGPALELAIKKIESDDAASVRQAKSKVLILISDGEDFGENTQEIARRIENKGIALFTLGVGTEEGGRIQLN